MAHVDLNGSTVGNALHSMLSSVEILPGDEASYQLCKTIYEWHPLGLKMAQKPLRIAMSQARLITIPDSPEEQLLKAFNAEWDNLDADGHILNTATLARVYGISSCVYGAPDIPTTDVIDPLDLSKLEIYFNDLDPLNTSGSLVLNQDPNSPDFQKHAAIAVSGQPYHRSRSVTIMNEKPIYISYTSSGFGFVGRSVYQRGLFPLKSFLQSMITDDLVTRKAGLIVAKMKPAGSIVNRLMEGAAAMKRSLLQLAGTGNVISISTDEEIETLDMQNTDVAMTTARRNILLNIAAADDMPARMLTEESLAEGFGEGSEDAKKEAQYIDRIRKWMRPLYAFFEPIVMYRAWSPAFYETIQAQFPEQYGAVPYEVALMQWKNSFQAEWKNLLEEPDSEKSKTEKVKLDGVVQLFGALAPLLDPENKAVLAQWAADNFNSLKMLFSAPLNLDYEAMASYEPPQSTTGEDDKPDDEKTKE